MSNFDIHIKKIKSVRAHIRDAAALDLCRMVILNDCEDDEVGCSSRDQEGILRARSRVSWNGCGCLDEKHDG